MGTRAIIDRTMVLSVTDAGSFKANLNEFEKQGYLSAHNRKFLQTALEAGHAAAHRGHDAGEAVLNMTMDIVENLVHAVFVLGKQADKVKGLIPPRPAPLYTKAQTTSGPAQQPTKGQ
jgi:hypothetical protein